MMENEITSVIKENGFELCSEIGHGSFSYCYKVYSLAYKQYFVCKVVPISLKKTHSGTEVYNNELSALCKIIHPHIIKIYKTFSNQTHLFLILEYCPHGDLFNQVETNGPIKNPVQLLVQISMILDALTYLEQNNIAHKDIKPSNILIDQHGRPKLADFGLSSTFERDTLSEDFSGSLAFLAPEVILRKPYDLNKADIWSFGVTLYYIAFGKLPFPLKDWKVLVSSILNCKYEMPNDANEVIKKIIMKSLVIDPSNRISFIQMKDMIDNEIKRLTAFNYPKIGKVKSLSSMSTITPIGKSNSFRASIRISAKTLFKK